jgi:hypothetical protein
MEQERIMKRRDFLGAVGGEGLLALGAGQVLALGEEKQNGLPKVEPDTGRDPTGPVKAGGAIERYHTRWTT